MNRFTWWWRGLDRWEKVAIAAWALVVLVVSIRTLGWPGQHSVYPVFGGAGQDWWNGENVYTASAQAPRKVDVFRYSPLVAALFAPISFLSPGVGGVLWRLVNTGVLLAGLFSWCRAVLPSSLSRTQQALLFLLVLPLFIGSANNGQSNPLVLGLLFAAVAAVSKERFLLAAGCMALACHFKVYPIAVGLLLAIVYGRPFAGRLVAALAIGLVLPFVFQHPDYVVTQYSGWLTYLCADDRSGFPVEWCNRDFKLLWRLCLDPLSPGAYLAWQFLTGIAMAILIWSGFRAGWPERRLLTLLVGLGSCWMTVFGPATESCTYLLVAPSVVWEVVQAGRGRQSIWSRCLPLASYSLLVAAAMACWFPNGRGMLALGVQPLAGLLLLAHLLGTHIPVRSRLDKIFRQAYEARSNGECHAPN